jgi:hypothetical protein
MVGRGWRGEFNMIRHGRFGLLVVGLFSLAFVASGQSRTAVARPASRPVQAVRPNRIVRGPVAARAPARNVQQVTASPAQAVSVPDFSIFPNGSNGFIFPGATSFDLGQLLNNVPGLGFDYEHVGALNWNFAEQAFINPVTQQEIALSERLGRFSGGFGGAFLPFWGGGYVEEPVSDQQQQQPPAADEQQPAPSPESENEASAPDEEQAAPLPDIGEFVLVLHNGNQIKAVAFTRQNDQIVYISKDGIRSSFPASHLDVEATQQLNRQRGTPLQISL